MSTLEREAELLLLVMATNANWPKTLAATAKLEMRRDG